MTGSAPLPPGLDATPVINAGEKRLADYLGMPTQHILKQLGLSPSPHPGAPSAAHPGGPMTPLNPASLISPVLNALSTLGTGQFTGMDPTNMLNGVSGAINSTAGPVQQAVGAVQQGWQGVSSAAAGAKTAALLANGTEVANQANGISSSLSTATADVAQARTQLIEIVNEFNATVAAIGPNIIFPWGWAAVLAAASQAVTHATQVMTQVQSSLATQAGAVSAIGKPVPVTAASQTGASAAGSSSSAGAASSSAAAASSSAASSSAAGSSDAMSMLSPLMSVGMMGISPLMSLFSAAGGAGGAASGAGGTLAGTTGDDPNSAAAGTGSAPKSASLAASASPAGGGGGAASSAQPVPRVTAPMVTAAPETTVAAASPRVAAAGMPMAGGGMMGGAPLAGAGHAASAGGAHTAASFLHTSDQGGKLVGGRDTVAPPVIGEVEPSEISDIELRI